MRLRDTLFLSLLLLAAPAHADSGAAAPSFKAEADTVRADEHGSVGVDFSLLNPGTTGLYADSLELSADDQDRGETGMPRQTVTPLQGLAKILAPAEAGGEQHYSWSAQAPFEHGLLTFRFVGHDGARHRLEFRTSVTLAGGVLTDAFPSETLHAAGHDVEVVAMPAQAPVGSAPGVLMVSPEGSHARRLIREAAILTQRGWHVLIVSPPGYGTSRGPRDWAGPATVAALSAALDRLKAMPGVDPRKLFVYGQRRGATAALLLAAKRTDLLGVVAQSAENDLWATWRAADDTHRATILAEAGRDSAAWKARSPLLQVAHIKALVSITHLSDEDTVCVAAGRALTARLDRAGARVDAHLPDATHRVTRTEQTRIATDFIRRTAF